MELLNNIKRKLMKVQENRKKYGKKKPIFVVDGEKKKDRREIKITYNKIKRRYIKIVNKIRSDIRKVDVLHEKMINTESATMNILLNIYINRLNNNQSELLNIKDEFQKYSYLNREKVPSDNEFNLWKITDNRVYRIEEKKDKILSATANDKAKEIVNEDIDNYFEHFGIDKRDNGIKNEIKALWQNTSEDYIQSNVVYKSIDEYYQKLEEEERIAQEKKEIELYEMSLENCKQEIRKLYQDLDEAYMMLKDSHQIEEYKQVKRETHKKYNIKMAKLLKIYHIGECQKEWAELKKNYKDLNIDSFYLALRQNIRTKYRLDSFEYYFKQNNQIYQDRLYSLEKVYRIEDYYKEREILKEEEIIRRDKISTKYGKDMYITACQELEKEKAKEQMVKTYGM